MTDNWVRLCFHEEEQQQQQQEEQQQEQQQEPSPKKINFYITYVSLI